MEVKTNINLSRYSDNELLVLLDHGILSVTEYETEMERRNKHETV